MADDLGFGDLGVCNHSATMTPNIDALARDGAFLTQHYSASPICAPARAAFLTGRYPQRAGVIDTFPHRGLDRLALGERTLGQLLGACGYSTGLIGKWHNGALGDGYHPLARGFDEFIGFRGGGQDYWDWRLERDGAPMASDGRYLTDVLTEEAARFVEAHRDEPFLLIVAYTAPHGPFQAPADAVDAVRRRRSQGPPLLDTITAMVEVMDRGVGQVLDKIAEHDLANDTVVMFTSDNGPWMRPGDLSTTTERYNLGLAGGKELVYEGGIRVPMLVRWPHRIAPGTTISDTVHFTDWVPTIVAMAAEPDGPDLHHLRLDGVDVGGVLRGEQLAPRRRCWQWSRYEPHPRCNAAIRDGDWKLVYPPRPEILEILPADPIEERRLRHDPRAYVPPTSLPTPPSRDWAAPPPQLFNLTADPGEQHDLAALDPTLVEQLQHALAEWFDAVEADRRLACDV
jgi:arylsulfatase A